MQSTVTRDRWSVSTITGTDIVGARLSVARHLTINGRPRILWGDGNGMTFATTEQANAYALEHGYTERMVIPWCTHCRTRHTTAYKRRSLFCTTLNKFV